MKNSAEKNKQSTSNNKGTQSEGGGTTESCTALACEVTKLAINCGHYSTDRNFILDVVNAEPSRGVTKVLQVIAKSGDPDEITVSFSGECAKKSKICPSIAIRGGENKDGFNSPYKFKAVPVSSAINKPTFTQFLSKYLIPDSGALRPTKYTIASQKCSGAGQYKATLEVFPTYLWKGGLSFGFFQSGGSNNKTLANKNEKGHWGIEGKLSLEIGTNNWSYENKIQQDKVSNVDEYFPVLKKLIGGMVERLEDIASSAGSVPVVGDKGNKKLVNVNVTWPKVTLGGELALMESQKNYNVDLGGKVSLEFDPLIKAEVTTDLITWCIKAAKSQGYGYFIEALRDKVAKGVGSGKVQAKGTIFLNLTLAGEIKAGLAWEKKADDTWMSTEGAVSSSVSAGITVSLVGGIHAEATVFWVKVTFGAEFHVKGARNVDEGIGVYCSLVATTDQGKPALGGSILFTGVAIYYTYYAEVGGSETDSEKKVVNQSRRRNGGMETKSASNKVNNLDVETKVKKAKLEKFVEIFPFNEWPKNSAVMAGGEATGLNKMEL